MRGSILANIMLSVCVKPRRRMNPKAIISNDANQITYDIYGG